MIDYMGLDEALDYIEAVEEGANADLIAKNSEYRKEIKALDKEFRKIWCSKDENKYSECKKITKKMLAVTAEFEKFVKNLEYTKENEKAIGNALGLLYFFSQHACALVFVVLGLGAFFASKNKNLDYMVRGELKGGGQGAMIGAGVGQLLKNVLTIHDDIDTYKSNFDKEKDKDVSGIKVKLLTFTKNTRRQIEQLNAAIATKEAYEQKAKKID